MVLHTLPALLKSAWLPHFNPFSCFGVALFFFFFLVELFWLHKLGSPSSYLEYGVAYCKDTVHGNPGDSGHLSHWGSKNSGLQRWHQAALRTSAAEAGFCNSTFLVASFFSISRDLLFTSWLLFKYTLWSLRTPVKTSLSLPFLIIIS